MTMQDELHLKSLQSKYESEAQDLREKLEKKKAKLKAAESRIRARISARERKRRTRRLILIGSLPGARHPDRSRPQGPPHEGTRWLLGTGSRPGTVRSGLKGGYPWVNCFNRWNWW